MRSLMNTRWKSNSCFINIQPGVLKLTAELLREHVVKLRRLYIAGLQRMWTTTGPLSRAVVDEDCAGGGLDVEVVVAGDGEVPHSAVVVAGCPAAGGGGCAAAGGA